MKKILCLLLPLLIVLTGLSFPAAAESGAETPLTYEELPEAHRKRYEEEMASALANARARAPGKKQFFAEARGDFNGYTGAKSDNSLKVDYRVSDSIVEVGEKVYFYVNMNCDYPPMVYTISGLVFDENFNKKGDLVNKGQSVKVDDTFKGIAPYYVPTEPGYFNFVVVVSDGNGNMVSMTSNTVQVYEKEEPLFNNIAIDGNLALMMNLDRSKLDVGTVITASVDVTTKSDPVKYRGVWTLTDEAGNILDTEETSAEVNARAEIAKLTFEYRPLKAGKLQFVITASDGDGNQIKNNTPVINVEDGFYFTAKLNRVSALMVGNSLTATYNIYGHECQNAGYFIGWECHDANGNTIFSKAEVVKDRSGKSTFTPRVGQEVEFYVGASCEHVSGEFPERAILALIGAIDVDLSLTAKTVKYGNSIGVKYSVTGGLEPYQKIIVNGYTYDESRDRTYNFMTKTVTEAEGTVSGAPKLGDEVYFVVEVVESDGSSTTWTTGKATLTGTPEVTDPKLTASLSSTKAAVGETITLTYRMSGGSGTINTAEPEASYVSWKKADGTVVSTTRLAKISGTPTFTPTERGFYYCELVLTDGYHQQISWKSDIFSVVAGVPGDADANGTIDAHDALLIMQYDAGWSVTLSKANADVNDDGGVDLSDAMLILRYGAGENVTLK